VRLLERVPLVHIINSFTRCSHNSAAFAQLNGHLALCKKARSTTTGGKNLPDEILQNVLKECQLSVCRCFPSDSSPNRCFCKFTRSNRALSEVRMNCLRRFSFRCRGFHGSSSLPAIRPWLGINRHGQVRSGSSADSIVSSKLPFGLSAKGPLPLFRLHPTTIVMLFR
jgi:hypothetical protein